MASASPTKPDSRTVHFRPSVTVLVMEHHLELSSAIRKQLWYEPKDYDAIKRKVLQIVDQYDKKNNNNTSAIERGLEHRTVAGRAMRSQYREAAREAVFQEQYRQRQQESKNGTTHTDISIATAYSAVSTACVQQALEMGQRDAAVAATQSEEDSSISRNSFSSRFKLFGLRRQLSSFSDSLHPPKLQATTSSGSNSTHSTASSLSSHGSSGHQSLRKTKELLSSFSLGSGSSHHSLGVKLEPVDSEDDDEFFS